MSRLSHGPDHLRVIFDDPALVAHAGLILVATLTGKGSGPAATVVVRVDHSALVRGHTVAGEECSIDGTGPVPVATAAKFACDAVIAALLTDGDRIADVRLVGRSIPARLRVALTARDRCCVVPGCDVTRHLEIHHLDPIAHAGPTSLDNTCRICSWHHDQITYRGADLARAGTAWVYTPGADDPGGGPFDDAWTDKAPPDPYPTC